MRNNRISDLLPLASLINITLLNLDNNQISDISSLAPLADLSRLTLYGNQISDIEPLVVNTGLAEGDVVDLRGNPLSTTSVSVYITQLEKRGVIIYQ